MSVDLPNTCWASMRVAAHILSSCNNSNQAQVGTAADVFFFYHCYLAEQWSFRPELVERQTVFLVVGICILSVLFQKTIKHFKKKPFAVTSSASSSPFLLSACCCWSFCGRWLKRFRINRLKYRSNRGDASKRPAKGCNTSAEMPHVCIFFFCIRGSMYICQNDDVVVYDCPYRGWEA